MKTLRLKLLIAFLIVGIAFTGCNDDNDDGYIDGPEDITIAIDATQAFNMKNFVASFEQSFVSEERYAWSFTHEYVNGKGVETYQNYSIYGAFGNKMFTIVHNFNTEGIIVSSERIPIPGWDDDNVIFTYKFDLEGYIVKLTKNKEGSVRDIVNMEYNVEKQLIKKTHEVINRKGTIDINKNEGGDEEWNEVFTYDNSGNVSTYTNSRYNYRHEYAYANGNMVELKYYSDGSLYDVQIFEYDSENRLILSYEEGSDSKDVYEYTGGLLREIDYYENRIDDITEYGEGYQRMKRWDFEYDGDQFEYCRAKEYAYDYNLRDSRYVTKKEFYNGTPENLILVGYSIIDSREGEYNKKTKESLYNAADVKLYYAEFEVDSYGSITATNWFDAAGNSIDSTDISEAWVFVLVQ